MTAINGHRIHLCVPVNAIRSRAQTIVDEKFYSYSDGCPVKTSRTRKLIFQLNVLLAIVLRFNGIFVGFRCPSRSIQRTALARRQGSPQTMYVCFVFTTPRSHNRQQFVVIVRVYGSHSLYTDTDPCDPVEDYSRHLLACSLKRRVLFDRNGDRATSLATELWICKRCYPQTVFLWKEYQVFLGQVRYGQNQTSKIRFDSSSAYSPNCKLPRRKKVTINGLSKREFRLNTIYGHSPVCSKHTSA